MNGFYSMLAFGIILFYAAVLLVILAYALTLRLLPVMSHAPSVKGALERLKYWLE